MDTRLWGGPLSLLKEQYDVVHRQTPLRFEQDSPSSSSEDEFSARRPVAVTTGYLHLRQRGRSIASPGTDVGVQTALTTAGSTSPTASVQKRRWSYESPPSSSKSRQGAPVQHLDKQFAAADYFPHLRSLSKDASTSPHPPPAALHSSAHKQNDVAQDAASGDHVVENSDASCQTASWQHLGSLAADALSCWAGSPSAPARGAVRQPAQNMLAGPQAVSPVNPVARSPALGGLTGAASPLQPRPLPTQSPGITPMSSNPLFGTSPAASASSTPATGAPLAAASPTQPTPLNPLYNTSPATTAGSLPLPASPDPSFSLGSSCSDRSPGSADSLAAASVPQSPADSTVQLTPPRQMEPLSPHWYLPDVKATAAPQHQKVSRQLLLSTPEPSASPHETSASAQLSVAEELPAQSLVTPQVVDTSAAGYNFIAAAELQTGEDILEQSPPPPSDFAAAISRLGLGLPSPAEYQAMLGSLGYDSPSEYGASVDSLSFSPAAQFEPMVGGLLEPIMEVDTPPPSPGPPFAIVPGSDNWDAPVSASPDRPHPTPAASSSAASTTLPESAGSGLPASAPASPCASSIASISDSYPASPQAPLPLDPDIAHFLAGQRSPAQTASPQGSSPLASPHNDWGFGGGDLLSEALEVAAAMVAVFGDDATTEARFPGFSGEEQQSSPKPFTADILHNDSSNVAAPGIKGQPVELTPAAGVEISSSAVGASTVTANYSLRSYAGPFLSKGDVGDAAGERITIDGSIPGSGVAASFGRPPAAAGLYAASPFPFSPATPADFLRTSPSVSPNSSTVSTPMSSPSAAAESPSSKGDTWRIQALSPTKGLPWGGKASLHEVLSPSKLASTRIPTSGPKDEMQPRGAGQRQQQAWLRMLLVAVIVALLGSTTLFAVTHGSSLAPAVRPYLGRSLAQLVKLGETQVFSQAAHWAAAAPAKAGTEASAYLRHHTQTITQAAAASWRKLAAQLQLAKQIAARIAAEASIVAQQRGRAASAAVPTSPEQWTSAASVAIVHAQRYKDSVSTSFSEILSLAQQSYGHSAGAIPKGCRTALHILLQQALALPHTMPAALRAVIQKPAEPDDERAQVWQHAVERCHAAWQWLSGWLHRTCEAMCWWAQHLRSVVCGSTPPSTATEARREHQAQDAGAQHQEQQAASFAHAPAPTCIVPPPVPLRHDSFVAKPLSSLAPAPAPATARQVLRRTPARAAAVLPPVAGVPQDAVSSAAPSAATQMATAAVQQPAAILAANAISSRALSWWAYGIIMVLTLAAMGVAAVLAIQTLQLPDTQGAARPQVRFHDDDQVYEYEPGLSIEERLSDRGNSEVALHHKAPAGPRNPEEAAAPPPDTSTPSSSRPGRPQSATGSPAAQRVVGFTWLRPNTVVPRLGSAFASDAEDDLTYIWLRNRVVMTSPMLGGRGPAEGGHGRPSRRQTLDPAEVADRSARVGLLAGAAGPSRLSRFSRRQTMG